MIDAEKKLIWTLFVVNKYLPNSTASRFDLGVASQMVSSVKVSFVIGPQETS